MSQFSTIGLTGRNSKDIVDSLVLLTRFLEVSVQADIVLDVNIAGLLGDKSYLVSPLEKLASQCDLVVVVGGDGSLLQVASVLP